jgi:hypothetical protein
MVVENIRDGENFYLLALKRGFSCPSNDHLRSGDFIKIQASIFVNMRVISIHGLKK